MDNNVGINCGNAGWDGQRWEKGKNWNNSERSPIKKFGFKLN